MRADVLVAFLLVNLACKPVERFDRDIPDAIAWYTVVGADGSAGVLTRREPGAPLIVVEGESPTSIIAWNDEPSLRSEPVRAPLPCEPTLPRPALFLRWAEELEELPVESAPALTIESIAGGCNLDPTRFSVDLSCAAERCIPTIEPLGACTFTVDASACGGPALVAGEGCIEPLEPGACTPAARSSAFASASCTRPSGSCLVDLYPPAEPAFDSEMVALPGESFTPEWLERYGQLRAESRAIGTATDLIALGDELIAYSAETPLESCSPTTPDGTFVFLDPDPFAITTTATAPPCIFRMLALGDRFAAIHRDGAGLALSTFDPRGRRLDSRPAARSAKTLAMLGLGDRLWVLSGNTGENAALTSYARETLASGPSYDLGSPRIVSMTALDASQLAFLEASPPAVITFELETQTSTRHVLPWPASPHDYDTTYDAAIDPSTGRLIVTGSRPPAAYILDASGETIARAVIHDSDAEPIAVAPLSPGFMSVAGSVLETSGERNVAVSIFDVAGARFLPGSQRIGPTFASKIVPVSDRFQFLLLPWTPAVVRLTVIP